MIKAVFSSARSIKGSSVLGKIALLFLLLGFVTQARALLYEWDFQLGGGIYTNSFIKDKIFETALDGEVDIFVKQNSDFDISKSVITLTYLDGGVQTIISEVDNPGFETDCDKDAHVGCVQKLESAKVKFQHFFISLKDDLGITDVSKISFAKLSLTGSGLDFSDPDLEVRWDWSTHLGLAHNLATPVPEPLTLVLFMGGLGLLILMVYTARYRQAGRAALLLTVYRRS